MQPAITLKIVANVFNSKEYVIPQSAGLKKTVEGSNRSTEKYDNLLLICLFVTDYVFG